MNLRMARSEKRVEVNITPLIDVVFLLLIFFMVSTTFNRESELQIALPEASAGSVEMPDQALEIVIAKDGSTVIAGKPLADTNAATVRQALAEALREQPDRLVVIRADGETAHQAVITVMDAARRQGIAKLSFATQLNDE